MNCFKLKSFAQGSNWQPGQNELLQNEESGLVTQLAKQQNPKQQQTKTIAPINIPIRPVVEW